MPDQAETERRCIEYLATLPPSIQGSNGSAALMRAARVVCWGFDLGESRGFDILWDHFNPRCEPPWSESEMLKKCRDGCDPTRADNPRGWLRDTAAEPVRPEPRSFMFAQSPIVPPTASEGEVSSTAPASTTPEQTKPSYQPLSEPPPPVSLVGVDDNDPYHLARKYLNSFRHDNCYTLRFFNGEFCLWKDGAFTVKADDEIKGSVSRFIEEDFTLAYNRAFENYQRNVERGGDDDPPKKHKVSGTLVRDTVSAIASIVRVPGGTLPPCWFCDAPPAKEIVSTRNGLLHLPSFVIDKNQGFTAPTPLFFTFNRVEFDFDNEARKPREWLKFLSELWPDDPDSIKSLQEWFGYLITPDTSIQKILLIIGPSRAGKGTIGNVLESLIGKINVSWPTLGRLATDFGTQDLLNKTVAIIADARLSGRTDVATLVEELLSISGGDTRTIQRKYKESVTGKLSTRFVFLSNQFPALSDASSAVLGRFVILSLKKSFYGEEDPALLDRLKLELPGILLWAIEGWQRIQDNKRFTEPDSSEPVREEARAVVAPISSFLTEMCECDKPDHFTTTTDLYEAWQKWCKAHGREHPGSREWFVIKLRETKPSLEQRRPGGDRRRGYVGIRLLSPFESGDL